MNNNLQKFGRNGWLPDRISNVDGKTFVITGANSGIGYETARILLQHGGNITMLCRSENKAETAVAQLKNIVANADINYVLMDLASLDSVRAAAPQVKQIRPTIDALICNAGIMAIPQRELTVDGFETQFAVNHLSHFLFTSLLYDNVAAVQGRFVNVSSKAHTFKPKRICFDDINFDTGYKPWFAYAQSKLANVLFTRELNRRLQASDTGMISNTCHPGWAATNLQTTGPSSLSGKIMEFGNKFLAQSAEKGSWPTVLCAVDPEAQGGKYYGPTKWGESQGAIHECPIAPQSLDDDAAKQLWDLSVSQTGAQWQI